MDAVDLRILRAMGLLPFALGPRGPDALKPGRLADVVGLSQQAVKERIARLEESGVIAGYTAHVNLRHLGLDLTTFHYQVPEDRKDRFLKDVEPLDGLAGYANFIGQDVCLDIYYRDEPELRRRQRLVETIAGVAAHPVFFYREMPPVARPLTNLDWRIARALRANSRRAPEDVAADVGVTGRTVRNRIDRMVEDGSLDVAPVINPARVEGAIPVALLLWLAPDHPRDTPRRVLKELDDHYLYWWVPRSPEVGHLDLSALAWSPGQVEELRARVLTVPGVAAARAIIPCGGVASSAWLDEAIERRIKETAEG